VKASRSAPGAAARRVEQWPLLLVVGGVVLGLVIASLGHNAWRIGCVVIGSSLCVGAVERIALPRRDAGLMQVRGQAFDVAVLALAGSAIIALAVWVHGS
jgi:hypothetical protein